MKTRNDDTILEYIGYDPFTGLFHWKIPPGGPKRTAGAPAGHICKTSGYVCIGFRYKIFTAHRVAWRIMTGGCPVAEIDHRNRVKTDNRFANLREATPSQNSANRAPKPRKYPKGVSPYNGKYKAGTGDYYLGIFDSVEAAHAAYVAKAKELYGDFARTE